MDLQPLNRYMAMAQRKVPHIRDVFVSTETDAVIEALVRWVRVAIAATSSHSPDLILGVVPHSQENIPRIGFTS